MSNPTVSILVPVYNVENFLRDCIKSIVEQTYKNMQIVLIDDGSTDNSWSIMQEYAKKDSRIEIYHQNNQGVASTRNLLLDKAKGDFILFVDSDDWLELTAVEVIINKQQEKDYDIVAFQIPGIKNDNIVLSQEKAIMLFLEHKTFRGSLWNKLIRNSLFHDLSFNPVISYGEDALMIWHILQKANSVLLSSSYLYNYRTNNNSLSHSYFSDKKFSAYYVWKQISLESEQWWPQYNDIANARFAIEMALLIKNAANSKYNNPKIINKMQLVVRSYGYLIRKTNLSSWKMSAFCWIAGRSFSLTKLFKSFC